MKITAHKSQIRTIKKDDPRFTIVDGFSVAPRAGFEISQHCPSEYRMIIQEAMSNGWLKPVAYMTEREMLFSGLKG